MKEPAGVGVGFADLNVVVTQVIGASPTRRAMRRRIYLATRILQWCLASAVYARLDGWAMILAAPVFAILIGSSISHVFHDAVHGTAVGHRVINDLLGLIVAAPSGLSIAEWRVRHAQQHHGHLNSPHLDPGLTVGRLIRLSSAQEWKPHHALQVLLEPILVLIGPIVLLSPHNVRQMPQAIRERVAVEKYVPFALYWASVGSLAGSLTGALAHYAIAVPFIATYAFIVTQGQHNNDLVGSQIGDDYEEFSERVLRCTSDVAPGSWVVSQAYGFVNHHVVHHLCPHIEAPALPAATRALREHCRGRSLPYLEHPSVWESVASHRRYLGDLAAAPVAEGIPANTSKS